MSNTMPIVCIPRRIEQECNATRIEELGFGISIKKKLPTEKEEFISSYIVIYLYLPIE